MVRILSNHNTKKICIASGIFCMLTWRYFADLICTQNTPLHRLPSTFSYIMTTSCFHFSQIHTSQSHLAITHERSHWDITLGFPRRGQWGGFWCQRERDLAENSIYEGNEAPKVGGHVQRNLREINKGIFFAGKQRH